MEYILLLISNTLLLTYLFVKKLHKNGKVLENTQKEKIVELIEEQDRSSKLLVRRDLDLTRANEKLRQLDMQKSEFISIIAHQMRTPLSAMKWTFNMLLKTELGQLTVDQQSFIVKAEENNNYMISLVEDMLFADKLESGKSDLNKTSVYLDDIIKTAIQDILPKSEIKKITINYEGCSPEICTVFADREKIRSVIQNLVDNAVAYTTVGGSVFIHIDQQGDCVVFSVRDTGIGIPKREQPYIFNKFYRAPNAARLEANGSGLGLFIVKRIIEAHNGSAWFESEEGQGATFKVRLPIK